MTKKSFTGIIPFQAGAGYLPGLDGLRAISVLIVVIAHLGFEKLVPGGFGVTVFFFVSGFLITRILVGEQNKAVGSIDLRGFYIRRFLRLMPALLVFIAGSTALIAPFGMTPNISEIFAAVFYVMNYYVAVGQNFGFVPIGVPMGHLWSLAVEEHFYLIFPAALAFLGKTHASRLRMIVGAIVLSALWRLVVIQYLGGSSNYTYHATECRIESIAWGCLLAIMLDGAPKENARVRVLVGWHCVALAIGALLFSFVFRDELFRGTWRYSLQGAALFVLILNLYTLRGARFALDILEIKPLQWIGRLSYSLYLWHWPMVWIAHKIEGKEVGGDVLLTFPALIGVVVASFMAASASYYGVERPMFALRSRFGGTPVEHLTRG